MLESDTWNGKNENIIKYWVYPGNIVRGFPGSSTGKESACNGGDPALIPGLGRSPGEGISNPLQYPYLGNSMDRGAWSATVHGVTCCCCC